MVSPTDRRLPDLDQASANVSTPPEIDCIRTRRLAAKLYRTVRLTLALQPPRRENLYIALDALAWAAAMTFAGTEDRDALDFFVLALKQNLTRIEEREMAASADASPPDSKAPFDRNHPDPSRQKREPANRSRSTITKTGGDR